MFQLLYLKDTFVSQFFHDILIIILLLVYNKYRIFYKIPNFWEPRHDYYRGPSRLLYTVSPIKPVGEITYL